MESCPGCKGLFEVSDGPVHRYMASSAACWHAYGVILQHEYSDPRLLPTHRLSVDTYAIQHPGDGSRRAIQSVGLHLARLMIQLESPLQPRQTNDVMLGLGRHKSTLPALMPPDRYEVTVADIVAEAGGPHHAEAVCLWARSAWQAWAAHHWFIREWVRATGAVP